MMLSHLSVSLSILEVLSRAGVKCERRGPWQLSGCCMDLVCGGDLESTGTGRHQNLS